MVRTTKPARQERKRGPKNRITPEVLLQVYWLCYLGATDIQLADAFGVVPATIDNWKKNNPEFLEALRKGKAEADIKVIQSFFKRATGFEYTEVHTTTGERRDGTQYTITRKVTKYYPPDTTAGIFWMKNRWRATWADVQHMQHSGTIDVKHTRIIDISQFTPQQREVLHKLSVEQLKGIQITGIQ